MNMVARLTSIGTVEEEISHAFKGRSDGLLGLYCVKCDRQLHPRYELVAPCATLSNNKVASLLVHHNLSSSAVAQWLS